MTSLDVPQLVQGAIGWLTAIGVPVIVFCYLILMRVAFLAGRSGRTRLDLAVKGLSDSGSGMLGRVRHLVLPLVAVTVLTVSFAIEQEVREGPSRSIQALSFGEGNTSWITEPGTRHLMNQSQISSSTVKAAVAALGGQGIPVVALEANFASLDTDERSFAGCAWAVDQQAGANPIPQPGHRCASADGEPCVIGSDRGIIVDSGNGLELGEQISIRGETFEVIAFTAQARSLLNRLIVYISPEGFARIDSGGDYYALIVAADRYSVERVLAEAGVARVEVRSQDQLRSDNEDFWAGNSTPLLLLLIGMIASFAGTATYLSQRAEQEQNRLVLGTLWAIGLPRPQMIEIQLLGSLLTIIATLPASWLAAASLISMSNRSIVGFSAETRVDHLLAAAALVCIGTLVAAASLANRTRKARPFQASI